MELEEENENLRAKNGELVEEIKDLERRIENLTGAIKDAIYNLNYEL